MNLPHGLSPATFDEALRRIQGRVVRTPMLRLEPGVVPIGGGVDARGVVTQPSTAGPLAERLGQSVLLKLECMQVTGSFKVRGALSRVLALPKEQLARGIITASGGNHGLAVAFAGRALGITTTIYLPANVSADKVKRIEAWGAAVVREGDVWDDAHAAALVRAERDGLTYVHSFADPDVVAGQGTIWGEIAEQAPDVDELWVSIGGGGLVSGVGAAARLDRPNLRVVGVEPVGAPTLSESLRAGHVVELPSIQTKAGTLAPRKSDPYTFEIVRAVVDQIVLVTDEEMAETARFMFETAHLAVELSGAAALAGLLKKGSRAKAPCVIVCGAGTDAVR